jgi:3-hydroxyacyl-[acyl-carrier-protein] dehydratase
MSTQTLRAIDCGESLMKKTLNIEEIQKLIPHRYPMLLIDRVIDIEGDERGVGIKNVSMNEPHFTGHFPDKPVMPGVLIVEAMAQTAAVLVINNLNESDGNKLVYFMSIEEARFRKPVLPGDTLQMRVEKIQQRSKVWKYRAKAYVGDVLHAEATYMAMLADRED